MNVFHRLELRREGQPLELLDMFGRVRPPPLHTSCHLSRLTRIRQRYDELKAELVRHERLLLREFGFLCRVEKPHTFLLHFAALLAAPPVLRQRAWSLANDSLRTSLACRFPPETLACGCLWLAARTLGTPLPPASAEQPEEGWWTIFGASRRDVCAVATVLQALPNAPRAEYVEVAERQAPPDAAGAQARAAALAAAQAAAERQRVRERDRERERERERSARERHRERSRERSREKERGRSRSRSPRGERRRDGRRRSRSRSGGRRRSRERRR